jgi:Cof subfamily protein (haloacid dehalogenase superfamily)
MMHKLFAFDLDGTLLTSEKRISAANAHALQEMADAGAVVAFASGRLGSSMQKLVPSFLDDIAMLTLNGAAVYMGKSHGSKRVFYAPLSSATADYLIDYAEGKDLAINYYIDDALHTVRTALTEKWIGLYYEQTATHYRFEQSLSGFRGKEPSKIIFVGAAPLIDEQELFFRRLWGDSVYICRTWDYYLEFLNPLANKGSGLAVLAQAYGIDLSRVVAFGDANNDIPMLRKAGLGIATANASPIVKSAARRVSPWSNDEDCIAREWEIIKKSEG